jgi:acyl-coenzyme A thioesterase PaaI-like protein
MGGTLRATVGTEPIHPFERHPGLTGRVAEARALADELRRLIRLSVSAAPSPEETAELTAQLAAVADRLEGYVPDEPLPRYAPSVEDGPVDGSSVETSMPFDLAIGEFNPLALPVRLVAEPPKALGFATFTVAYEGAPGCVHGGALAATFDIVLSAANSIAAASGPTVRLNLHYRRPTLTGEEARFEGWVTEVTDRRVFSLGRIVQGGTVTVEAEGEFAIFDRDAVARLAAGRRVAFENATQPGPA